MCQLLKAWSDGLAKPCWESPVGKSVKRQQIQVCSSTSMLHVKAMLPRKETVPPSFQLCTSLWTASCTQSQAGELTWNVNLKNWLSDNSLHCSDHYATIQPAVLHSEPDRCQKEVVCRVGLFSLGRVFWQQFQLEEFETTASWLTQANLRLISNCKKGLWPRLYLQVYISITSLASVLVIMQPKGESDPLEN